jgi:hypothetical protein
MRLTFLTSCCMFHQSNALLCDQPNRIWWIMLVKMHLLQFSLSSCYFLFLRTEYYSQQFVYKLLQSILPLVSDQVSHPFKTGKIIIVHVLVLRNEGNSFIIDTRLWAGRQGSDSRLGQWWDFSSTPPHPDRLWDTPILLSSGYLGLFHPGLKQHRGAWSWPLTSLSCWG